MCPKCYSRKPAEMYLVESSWYFLGLIPVWTCDDDARSYYCRDCGEWCSDQSDWGDAFSQDPDTPTWKCRSCGTSNHALSFHRAECGKHV